MKNFPIFAFAQGNETKEFVRKLYIGVAPVTILAVNPTKAALSEIYGTEIENDPVYVNKVKLNAVSDKEVRQVRVDYIIKTANDANLITRASFFVRESYRFNKDNTKVEVINKYGETTWLPIACIKENAPVPSNMKWYDTSGVRPAYVGEAELTDFMKQYLGIPNKSFFKEGVLTMIEDPSKAEVGFEHIKDWFDGNFKELNDVLSIRPNNKVQMMFGVRTSDDNKQYQAVFTQKALKASIKDCSRLDSIYQDAKQNGRYAATEFSVQPFAEYKVEATDFSKPETKKEEFPMADPWANFSN